MTITAEAVEAPPSILLVLGGQMPCDIAGCKVIFGHPVDLDSEFAAPARQQLQQAAAAEHGWKQTIGRLFICPDCASGPLSMVVADQPHWSTPARAEAAVPPVMHGDNVSTIALPAITAADLRASASRRPYDDTPKGSAA